MKAGIAGAGVATNVATVAWISNYHTASYVTNKSSAGKISATWRKNRTGPTNNALLRMVWHTNEGNTTNKLRSCGAS